MTKVLVIGLGSMGKRRIRLLKKMNKKMEIWGVDARQERCAEAEQLYDIFTSWNLEDVLVRQMDCAFVCTSPLEHAELVAKCLGIGLHVFSEINLVADGYDSNIALAREKGVILFLSSTFLYRDEISYIKKEVMNAQSVITYSYHVGQYLPDWHPWESYTEYFVGNDRTNGCREIMAIEFPWLYEIFGEIVSYDVKKNKKTKLSTSYNDSYLLLLEHESGTQGAVLLDVVSRKAVRNLEIFGEDLYLSWDGTPNGLKKLDIDACEERSISLYSSIDARDEYAKYIIEDAYMNEIEEFFTCIEKGENTNYGFEEDKVILKLLDEIEG